MRDTHFKFQVGEIVTHMGFLYPRQAPIVQRFKIVGQTLVAGPVSTERYYHICSVNNETQQTGVHGSTLRVEEANLAQLPEDEAERCEA
ncbi:MAG: hypothetical protein AB7P69_00900 [Candidatus Binatia bacterium]